MFSMACFKIKLELFFLAIKDSAKCKNTLSQGSFSDIYSEQNTANWYRPCYFQCGLNYNFDGLGW